MITGDSKAGGWLLYGAYGYTGELIARLAVARGHRPVLAGRNADALRPLAAELGLEARAFGLEDPVAIAAALAGAPLVLHCAGPFAHTHQAMASACLQARVHYLDITGEIAVFESLARRDREAREAGVMLLPGVGFDVVPSDCLAVHLARRLPTATHLALGLQATAGLSRGTARTMIENLEQGGAVRINGTITRVPSAWKSRAIDFGGGPRPSVTIPWGDVATAYYSTGIPNIEVYGTGPTSVRVAMKLTRGLGWLLGSPPVQRFLKARVQAGPAGPTAHQRATRRSFFWGEAMDADGRAVVSRLQTPEGYALTSHTALAIVERVLRGEAPAGFQTPGKAYGPDFILTMPGVERTEEPRLLA